MSTIYRYLRIFELKPECIDLYVQKHKNAHINNMDHLKGLKASGAVDMKCFIFKNYSILYTESEVPLKDFISKAAQLPAGQQWCCDTSDWFLEMNPDGSYKYIVAEKIFDLNEQLKGNFTIF